jgi:hypothetical protein
MSEDEAATKLAQHEVDYAERCKQATDRISAVWGEGAAIEAGDDGLAMGL